MQAARAAGRALRRVRIMRSKAARQQTPPSPPNLPLPLILSPPSPRSQNGQPAYITWNLMGMMNNCYFRIKVLHHVDEKVGVG